MNTKDSLLRLFTLLICLLLLLPGPSSAQDTGEDSVHWAYAAFLGTGWYKLDSNRQVYVLRIPPRWYFRDSSIDESGKRQLGIEFHFPLTFGLHKLEQLDDFIDLDNIGTVSFNPGVEIEYPVSNRCRQPGWDDGRDGFQLPDWFGFRNRP